MTHFLQSVLGTKDQEPLFTVGLMQLEKATGNSGVDTRLIADILEKAHKVMRKLKLDIKDTTAHELYFALNSAVRRGEVEDLLEDTDYVLYMIEDLIISFNIIDVIESSHHELPFIKRSVSHGQRSLRGELVSRYIEHVRTDEVTTRSIASSIGLLPESDTWYNNFKHKPKQIIHNPKELLA